MLVPASLLSDFIHIASELTIHIAGIRTANFVARIADNGDSNGCRGSRSSTSFRGGSGNANTGSGGRWMYRREAKKEA
jgi:hypothetical protein